jgi:hypothetical protein
MGNGGEPVNMIAFKRCASHVNVAIEFLSIKKIGEIIWYFSKFFVILPS